MHFLMLGMVDILRQHPRGEDVGRSNYIFMCRGFGDRNVKIGYTTIARIKFVFIFKVLAVSPPSFTLRFDIVR